ncbi:MAG TPA: hypothetical protein VF584_12550 [Longimicrobium sp.]|jgi:hypothetical protein
MMRQLLAAAAVLALLDTAAPAQQLPRTPAPGSSERRAILDALRPSVDRAIGESVIFADVHVAVEDGWAYVRAMPYRLERAHGDTFRVLATPDATDPYVYGLLRDEGGWKVAEAVTGVARKATPYTAWATRHSVPVRLFMRDPDAVSLEAAMREYINAFAAGDPQRFLALLPRTSPIRWFNTFVDDTIGSSDTRSELAESFRKKDEVYHELFTGFEDGGTEKLYDFYAEHFQGADKPAMWRRYSDTIFVDPTYLASNTRSGIYVKWKKEGGRWVVVQIGYVSA